MLEDLKIMVGDVWFTKVNLMVVCNRLEILDSEVRYHFFAPDTKIEFWVDKTGSVIIFSRPTSKKWIETQDSYIWLEIADLYLKRKLGNLKFFFQYSLTEQK